MSGLLTVGAGVLLALILFAGAATASIRLSRAFAWQMLMVFALGGYVLAVALIDAAIAQVAGAAGPLLRIGFVAGATTAALVALLSRRNRAALRVQLAKHMFRHRYDYREEWARFTATLGRRGEGAEPLPERIAKAFADVLDAPGALLLTRGDGDGLEAQANWGWSELCPPHHAGGDRLARWLEATGRIVELDALRAGAGDEAEVAAIPEWILAEPKAWALVPLIHFERLQGAAVIARPPVARRLDWEDFDLLRVIGRQAASTLAEARGQEALGEARRFDEFNRRFAFIVHDIKNLVSQLGLVARNAERHADNPAFRADMIATLQSSTAKMNDLLARLAQSDTANPAPPRPLAVAAVIEAVARRSAGRHRVVSMISGDPHAFADPARLDQALAHLVTNAIEASPADEPVVLHARAQGDAVVIEVRDKGVGMSGDFVRARLFKPFDSTKPSGFGVGAHEARALVLGMGGRIEVSSREREGSVFTITLPAASLDRARDERRAA